MSGPEKWDWTKSNGDATDAETTTAYAALTSGGRTADFAASVWNDIINKISAQRIAWTDTEWNSKILNIVSSRMSAGDSMTANRFNSAVQNMPPIKNWPWQSTLGRTDIKKGDRCYGMYFIYLTDGLNYWIDLVPIPVKFSNTANWAHSVLGHALPAIHIMVNNPPLSGEFSHSTKVFVAQSTPVQYSLQVNHTGELTLSILNAQHIEIINFAHVDFENKVTMYPTTHIVGDLNAKLTHEAKVTFGNIIFMQIRLPFTYSTNGKIYTDTALPMYAQMALGQYDTDMLISLALHCRLSFSLVAKLQGEPRIIERDSIPVKEVLQAQESTSLTVTCQEVENVIARLYATSIINFTLSTQKAIRLIVDLQSTLTMYGDMGVADICRIAINAPLGELGLVPTVRAGKGKSIIVPLSSFFTSGAKVDNLSGVLAKADLQSLSDIAVCISTNNVARLIATLTAVSGITANADTLTARYVKANFTERLDVTVAAALKNVQHIAAHLDAYMSAAATARLKAGAAVQTAIENYFRIGANVGTLGMFYVASNVDMRLELFSQIFEKQGLHIITHPSSALILSAAMAVKNVQATKAIVSGSHSLFAKSVLTAPGYTAAHLDAYMSAAATAVSTLAPTALKAAWTAETNLTARMTSPAIIGYTAALSGSHSGIATLGLANMYPFEPTITASLAGEYNVSLATVYSILANMTGQHTGFSTVSLTEAGAIKGKMQIIQTATATLGLLGLVLVSELEDMLVSDLDDMLVTNVEYH